MRTSPSPQSLPIRPAATERLGTAPPRSNTSTAVTLPSPAGSATRSRVLTVPERNRTYAIRSPAPPRSILNTVPETGPAASPSPPGSSSRMPRASSATPAPVIAEPKNTGCASARRDWAVSAASTFCGSAPPPSTSAASSASSRSASTSAAAAPNGSPIATTAGESFAAISSSTACGRALGRSILLTNSSVGTRSRCSARISTRVCACTPSTAETTSTAPSSTASTRSTSAMKSGWPGVSMRLTVRSPSSNETTADLIVMPRRRSSSSESVRVVPSSTLPGSSMTPAAWSSRSVRLVLPASTWARTPRFKVRTALHVLHGDRDGVDGRAGPHSGSFGWAWRGQLRVSSARLRVRTRCPVSSAVRHPARRARPARWRASRRSRRARGASACRCRGSSGRTPRPSGSWCRRRPG